MILIKLLNYLIDSATPLRSFRALIRYAANRIEGLQYGSYTLADEVSLALSFEKRSRDELGAVVIDAGANRGDWSRLFLASQPSIEKLIIVEPQAFHLASLGNIGKVNSRVAIEQVAIGASPGELSLYADEEGSG